MVWFLREPSANRARILDLRKMKCAYPDKMNTKSISLLREADICSASKYKNLCEVCTFDLFGRRNVKIDLLFWFFCENAFLTRSLIKSLQQHLVYVDILNY